MSTPQQPPAPALSPSAGRVIVAVILGLLYGFLAFIPFFILSFFLAGSVGAGGAALFQNVLGVVLPVLFIFWQVKREYKRAGRRAQKP